LNKDTWKKIQYWKHKYNSTPNGWPVALMIGEEYISELSKVNKSKRKKIK